MYRLVKNLYKLHFKTVHDNCVMQNDSVDSMGTIQTSDGETKNLEYFLSWENLTSSRSLI